MKSFFSKKCKIIVTKIVELIIIKTNYILISLSCFVFYISQSMHKRLQYL